VRKTAILGISTGIVLVLLLLCILAIVISSTSAFAMPSSNSVTMSLPLLDLPPVYGERLSNGKTQYAYAKWEENNWTKIKDGAIFTLTNQKGESFQAKITIWKPQPKPASAGGRSPEPVWVNFTRTSPNTASGLPEIGPAVIFKVW